MPLMLRTAILSCLILMIVGKGVLIKHSYKSPITWSYHTGKVSPTLYEVDIEADMLPNWHINSLNSLNTDTCFPTSVIFEPDKYIKLVDSIEEKGSVINVMVSNLPYAYYSTASYYEGSVIFSHYFFLKGTVKNTALKGVIQYQLSKGDTVLPVNSEFFEISIRRQ